MKIGILGGGLAGLALRYFIKHDTEILEKEAECGGLCRSIQENGFIFDQGGHLLFSKNKGVLGVLRKILGNNVEKRRRNNKVYYDKRFLKYPFENGLSGLSRQDNFECLYYYLNNKHAAPNNFKEWLYFNFGKGITDKYLLPYNEKIWKFRLDKMSLGWVARIPKPPMEDIIKSALGIETEGYLHQLDYLYPKRGGIQALIRSLESARHGPITTSFTVKTISKGVNKWVVTNGASSKTFDRLVSTMPLFDLIKCLAPVPRDVIAALGNLKYNSAIIAMLGLARDKLSDYTAIYFPAKDTLYHRVCLMHNFSRHNAPGGKAALIAEITCKKSDALWRMPDNAFIEEVATSLAKDKIIDKGSLELSRVYRMEYAYIIYDTDYQKNLTIVKQYLEKQGIMLCGRFAEFEYINMDDVIKRSRKLAAGLNKRF